MAVQNMSLESDGLIRQQNIGDQYFDLKKLSDYSCLSVRTLRQYISSSEDPLPCFRLMRKLLVRKSEFDQWMQKRRSSANKVSRIVDEVMSELRQ